MCGELNPGPLPCEGSVIPLHHTPEVEVNKLNLYLNACANLKDHPNKLIHVYSNQFI